jgi:hypothetical protein
LDARNVDGCGPETLKHRESLCSGSNLSPDRRQGKVENPRRWEGFTDRDIFFGCQ